MEKKVVIAVGVALVAVVALLAGAGGLGQAAPPKPWFPRAVLVLSSGGGTDSTYPTKWCLGKEDWYNGGVGFSNGVKVYYGIQFMGPLKGEVGQGDLYVVTLCHGNDSHVLPVVYKGIPLRVYSQNGVQAELRQPK